MINSQSYEGIIREIHPTWFGWYIIDLLNDNQDETEEHRQEIKLLLDLEVRLFRSEILTLPVETGF